VNEGFQLLMSSASKGDPASTCDVGFCYHLGQGVPLDATHADDHYQVAAGYNDPKGWNNHG
jgi:TPR repeat protein